MKYASIIMCHYSKADDFGEKSLNAPPGFRSRLMKNAIETLAKSTDYPAELIIIDNGGNPDDTDYLVQKVREGIINTLIRYKENRHFAYAWNEGAKIATGDYLSFVCNDIEFMPGWLSSCVKILEDYPDKDYVATPFITYDKRKHTREITKEGYRVNMRSGSNCMVMRKEDWPKLGEFPVHRIGGSLWYTRNFRKGWWFVAPPNDLAIDRGWRKGVDFSVPIKVEKRLLGGSIINFEEKIQKR